jgi:hypothetical protein
MCFMPLAGQSAGMGSLQTDTICVILCSWSHRVNLAVCRLHPATLSALAIRIVRVITSNRRNSLSQIESSKNQIDALPWCHVEQVLRLDEVHRVIQLRAAKGWF